MPIVTVELVADPDRPLEHNIAQLLADAIGRVLSSPTGHTWVRLRSLQRNDYAENGVVVDTAGLPVFVTVVERQVSTGGKLQAEAIALTQAVAQIVGRPTACVHIVYAPAGVGRVSFGGKLVE